MIETPETGADYDPKLAQIISLVESVGPPYDGEPNQYAIRFEPGIYRDFDVSNSWTAQTAQRIALANRCSNETARVLYSTSYGLFQMMGFNLYRLQTHLSIGAYMADPEFQRRIFGAFLQWKGIAYSWEELLGSDIKLSHFATTYNGSLAYIASMKEAAAKIGVMP